MGIFTFWKKKAKAKESSYIGIDAEYTDEEKAYFHSAEYVGSVEDDILDANEEIKRLEGIVKSRTPNGVLGVGISLALRNNQIRSLKEQLEIDNTALKEKDDIIEQYKKHCEELGVKMTSLYQELGKTTDLHRKAKSENERLKSQNESLQKMIALRSEVPDDLNGRVTARGFTIADIRAIRNTSMRSKNIDLSGLLDRP